MIFCLSTQSKEIKGTEGLKNKQPPNPKTLNRMK